MTCAVNWIFDWVYVDGINHCKNSTCLSYRYVTSDFWLHACVESLIKHELHTFTFLLLEYSLTNWHSPVEVFKHSRYNYAIRGWGLLCICMKSLCIIIMHSSQNCMISALCTLKWPQNMLFLTKVRFCFHWYTTCLSNKKQLNLVKCTMHEHTCDVHLYISHSSAYGSGRGICETLWGDSFIYADQTSSTPDSERYCLVPSFPVGEDNPNIPALRNIFPNETIHETIAQMLGDNVQFRPGQSLQSNSRLLHFILIFFD